MDSQPSELLTRGGVRVTRTATPFDPAELGRIAALVDERRGGVMSSGMEYPGRYSRWHMAYADPCAEIIATGTVCSWDTDSACVAATACVGVASSGGGVVVTCTTIGVGDDPAPGAKLLKTASQSVAISY